MTASTIKRCHTCGATQTLKGNPLTGSYCSPDCQHKAYSKMNRRSDTHGRNHSIRLSDEQGGRFTENPFEGLFDNPEDE